MAKLNKYLPTEPCYHWDRARQIFTVDIVDTDGAKVDGYTIPPAVWFEIVAAMKVATAEYDADTRKAAIVPFTPPTGEN